MLSSVRSGLGNRFGLESPVVATVTQKLKESLMLSMATAGVFMFLFSAVVLTAIGKDVLAALFGLIGINVTIISLISYATYHILDRIV